MILPVSSGAQPLLPLNPTNLPQKKFAMVQFSRRAVEALAQKITRRSPALSRSINRRRFRANFGVSAHTVSYLWELLSRRGNLPRGFRPSHLLWTLVFLNLYASEPIAAALCGCDEKTLRKWVWIGVDRLCELELVSHPYLSYLVISMMMGTTNLLDAAPQLLP